MPINTEELPKKTKIKIVLSLFVIAGIFMLISLI